MIEGDGATWRTPTRPPIDPTPKNSGVLELAELIHKKSKSNVLYMARPCQYPKKTGAKCQLKDWTTDRFAAKHVDTLLRAFARDVPLGSQVTLFGHSGGGVVALQLASQLKEKFTIKSVVVAGTPIDVDAWIEANGYSKLNIENYTDALRQLALASVPVIGVFGDKDTTAPDLFLGVAVESDLNVKVHIVSNADHGQLVTSKSTLDILLNH